MTDNSKNKIITVAVYILVPIIYAAIGIFAVYMVFKPYIQTANAVIDMLEVAPQGKEFENEGELPSLFDDSMLTDDMPPLDETTDPDNPGKNDENGEGEEDPKDKNIIDGKTLVSPTDDTKYGVLQIPSLGVKADLYYGDSNRVLDVGVGQSTGSFMPGNGRPILIAGHNNTYFHFIGYLKPGDLIKITTYYGVFVYEVTGSKLTTNSDKSAYDVGKQEEELMMYTCYPFYMLGMTKQRYFVYAKKVAGPMIVY